MGDLSGAEFNEARSNYQKMMAEDAIVEIAGKTGASKKWGATLKAAEDYTADDPTPEQNAAMENLQGEFGQFTSLVVDTWKAPANIVKRSKNTV